MRKPGVHLFYRFAMTHTNNPNCPTGPIGRGMEFTFLGDSALRGAIQKPEVLTPSHIPRALQPPDKCSISIPPTAASHLQPD